MGLVPYNDLPALEAALKADPHVAAFMLEPIQVHMHCTCTAHAHAHAHALTCTCMHMHSTAHACKSSPARSGHRVLTACLEPLQGEARVVVT